MDLLPKIAMLVTPFLVAALIYFYKRDVGKTDGSVKDLGKKIDANESKGDKKVEKMEGQLSALATTIETHHRESLESGVKLRTMMLEVKEDVAHQVNAVVKQATDIHRQIDKMFHQSAASKEKIEEAFGKIIQIEEQNGKLLVQVKNARKVIESHQAEIAALKKRVDSNDKG